MMGAMPSQCPSAPSALVNSRNSLGQVSRSNSTLPWPTETALFDGLVELVVAEVTLPGRTGEWAQDFRAAAHAARATLLAHPQANIVHDPGRLFELALDGLILALQAHHLDDQ
jgi:hypothetical protein